MPNIEFSFVLFVFHVILYQHLLTSLTQVHGFSFHKLSDIHMLCQLNAIENQVNPTSVDVLIHINPRKLNPSKPELVKVEANPQLGINGLWPSLKEHYHKPTPLCGHNICDSKAPALGPSKLGC